MNQNRLRKNTCFPGSVRRCREDQIRENLPDLEGDVKILSWAPIIWIFRSSTTRQHFPPRWVLNCLPAVYQSTRILPSAVFSGLIAWLVDLCKTSCTSRERILSW
jgi:hypothetical protein